MNTSTLNFIYDAPLYTWLAVPVAFLVLDRIYQRLLLSRAKHRSLNGHSKWSKRIARLIPYYGYDETQFFASDGAPADIATRRKLGFFALANQLQSRSRQSLDLSDQTKPGVSDMAFVDMYRVPFQYRDLVRRHLRMSSFMSRSAHVWLTDLDGNEYLDLTGSYGVNVLGYDFYKQAIRHAVDVAEPLGPVLGQYHPVVADNVKRLLSISGMDEVSFHMSGTEAVMQAVRLARYHTGKTHVVRFCGAYHGWWGDVQPGIGNPNNEPYTYTLADMSEAALKVLATRRDIACVLVNPLQALHPNVSAPGDSSLVSSARRAQFDRVAYAQWLRRLRQVCTDAGIALIFDEVFVGFRLCPGGAQAYFDVHADIVTYGKTLGGGFPVGAVCGKAAWMKRFRPEKPADICFARGTFNSHPYVMAAMNEFLRALDSVEIQALYEQLDEVWLQRVGQLNQRMEREGLPIRVAGMSTIWTVLFTEPSRYNWMLQFYLRAHGLLLSWVGSGRIVFSLNYTQTDFDTMLERFVRAAYAMKLDGWWWSSPALSNKTIAKTILLELLEKRVGQLRGH